MSSTFDLDNALSISENSKKDANESFHNKNKTVVVVAANGK